MIESIDHTDWADEDLPSLFRMAVKRVPSGMVPTRLEAIFDDGCFIRVFYAEQAAKGGELG